MKRVVVVDVQLELATPFSKLRASTATPASASPVAIAVRSGRSTADRRAWYG